MNATIDLTGQVVVEPEQGWIGVDLDGTLAEFDGWKGPEVIGKPIPAMMARVKRWLAEGKWVKIFTARACYPEHIPFVQKWLIQNGLPELEVTDKKDYQMAELWDDKAVHVELNTGKVVKRRRA
jgi:hypothetical protein